MAYDYQDRVCRSWTSFIPFNYLKSFALKSNEILKLHLLTKFLFLNFYYERNNEKLVIMYKYLRYVKVISYGKILCV